MNNIKLYRIGQTEDSLETVHDSLNIVAAFNDSYTFKIQIKDILDSDLLLCASFWSKRHSCDRKVETVFFFHFLILRTLDISSQVQY